MWYCQVGESGVEGVVWKEWWRKAGVEKRTALEVRLLLVPLGWHVHAFVAQ
jgi:hypothetical protein